MARRCRNYVVFKTMFITKCDVCKKEIKKGEQHIIAGENWLSQFSFCTRCGKPIAAFLKKHKLPPEKKVGLRK